MTSNFHITVKMAISATLALLLANVFNLDYAAVAAVIAVLSIQNTRREAIKIARNRVFSSLLSIFLSAILYSILGHNPVAFFIFLLLFITLNFKLKIEVGMVVGIVLSTHLLVASVINVQWIINELLIMTFGISTASLANIFMPSLEDDFKKDKLFIEENYKLIISKMAKSLITQTVDLDENRLFNNLENALEISKNTSYRIFNNSLFKSNTYYTDYTNMRINQFYILKRMRSHFEKLYMSFYQTKVLSDFTNKVANNICETNNCKELLENLSSLKQEFKSMPLPKTREEFENRAMLFNFLNDLEEFLLEKRKFALIHFK